MLRRTKHHRVIDGRIYSVVTIEAADTRAAAKHISAERPTSENQKKEYRSRAVAVIA